MTQEYNKENYEVTLSGSKSGPDVTCIMYPVFSKVGLVNHKHMTINLSN
jgi:hypothetical protein